jgi:hypothetical protein
MPAAGWMIGEVHGDLSDTRLMREGGDDTPRHRAFNANKFQVLAPLIQGAKCRRKN